MICTNRVRGLKKPAAFLATSLSCLIQVSPAQVTPATKAQPGGAGGIYPTYEPDDNSGFVPIFDGRTLKGGMEIPTSVGSKTERSLGRLRRRRWSRSTTF